MAYLEGDPWAGNYIGQYLGDDFTTNVTLDVPPPPRYACRYADGSEFDLTETEYQDTGCMPTNVGVNLRSVYDLQTGSYVQQVEPVPGDPDFVGPVQPTDGSSGSPGWTLPVEVFEKVIPPIIKVIQPGGVPTIPSPIPTSLPPRPAQMVSSSFGLLAVGVVLLLVLGGLGKRG